MIAVFRRAVRYVRNRFRYINFFTKLVSLFLAAVFLPLAIFSFLFVHNAVSSAEEKTAAAVDTNFKQVYSTLNAQFTQLKKYGDMLINDNVPRSFFRNQYVDADYFAQRAFKTDFGNTLHFIENSQGVFRLRIYVDPKYFYIVDNSYYFSVNRLKDVSWFRDFDQIYNRTYWLDSTEVDELYNTLGVIGWKTSFSYLAKGVGLEDYSRLAVVFQLDFLAEDLQALLDNVLFLPGSCAFLVDEDGGVIAGAGLDDLQISPEEIYKKGDISETLHLGGGDYWARTSSFDENPWTLYYLVPQKTMYTYSELGQSLFFIFFAFLCGVLVFTSTLFFSKHVTAKIRSVIGGMQGIRHGRFVNIPTTDSHDEIDELIEHYNYTVDELQLLIEAKYLSGVELKAAQLRALHAQINPHFLYNTLELINCYAFAEDPAMVEKLVSSLSNFYKLSLNHGRDVYQLWQELKLVEAYFEIQKIRYPNSLQLEMQVPSTMMQYSIPNITLQPIIENSIAHGIMNKPDKKGSIIIKGEEVDRMIQLQIIDDGVGIPEEIVDELNAGNMAGSEDSTGSHYGIYNINQRIQNYYGEDYKLHFESTPGVGTTVTVILPQL